MIYVHIPFCRSFCTYCDFYSEVAAKCRGAESQARQDVLFESYSKALGREISLNSGMFTSNVNTLYIGGGTPSVLPLSVYTSLIRDLSASGISAPFEEFTFEANPEDIVEKGEAYVEDLIRLGVNRFSMGVQSFDDDILRWMNRRHDVQTARKAYSILENAGADNISIDLIFGLPQLSVEPGSALAKLVERGIWSEASEELCSHQYSMLCDTLAKAGYHHYEISNFAQPGYEAKHNSAYWNHTPYIGLGPGAHSFVSGSAEGVMSRRWNNPDLRAYIADPGSVREHENLTQDQIVMEKIMLSLRTSAGISESFLRVHADPSALASALHGGDLIPSHIPGNLRIAESRFFVSDNIICSLV